jgi:hypothetical protein
MKKWNVILPLGALACWLMLGVPGALHAQQATGPQQGPGQQGNFEGDHADTGAAAKDTAEDNKTKETAAESSGREAEVAETTAETKASVDADRVEDQHADLNGPNP